MLERTIEARVAAEIAQLQQECLAAFPPAAVRGTVGGGGIYYGGNRRSPLGSPRIADDVRSWRAGAQPVRRAPSYGGMAWQGEPPARLSPRQWMLEALQARCLDSP